MTAIDDYLDRLRHELQSSPEETEEVLREVRSHLELSALDLERHSGDGAAALAQAMERFGGVRQIGGELRQVHGRATPVEAVLATLPMLLFSVLLALPLPALQSHYWIAALLLAATALAWRARWPVWWWAWLGWVPFIVPTAPGDLAWGAALYVVILLLVVRRDWLAATLATYPLPTVWAFRHLVLSSSEVRNVGWSSATLGALGLGMAIVWCVLLLRVLRPPRRLRTPPGTGRVAMVLQGQATVFLLNGLFVVAARLWPTYPYPYAFTLRYFVSVTVPYAMFHGLPFLLFFLLTLLPAMLALAQARARRQRPPSRPALGG